MIPASIFTFVLHVFIFWAALTLAAATLLMLRAVADLRREQQRRGQVRERLDRLRRLYRDGQEPGAKIPPRQGEGS